MVGGANIFGYAAVVLLSGALLGGISGHVWLGSLGILPGVVGGFGLAMLPARMLRKRDPGALGELFLDSAFAILGAVADFEAEKNRDEALFQTLQLSHEQCLRARVNLRRGRAAGFSPRAEMTTVVRLCRDQYELKILFLQVQIHLLAADRELYRRERNIMQPVARALGLGLADLQAVEALFDVRRARRERRARHAQHKQRQRQQHRAHQQWQRQQHSGAHRQQRRQHDYRQQRSEQQRQQRDRKSVV